jgi:hypothetical protein
LQAKVHVLPEQVVTWPGFGVPHAAHPPAQQMPAPQEVPSGTASVREHWGWPVPHNTAPVWQPSALVQEAPAAQLQTPSMHARFAPHAFPFGAFPMAVHVEVPVPQDVMPTWHTSPARLHASPAAHGTHAP